MSWRMERSSHRTHRCDGKPSSVAHVGGLGPAYTSGGGRWQLKDLHVPGWLPRRFQELAPEAFKLGFQHIAERFGCRWGTCLF